ncbi:MAG: 50S ribosomal protein L2 [Candidatus Sungbacteria bacterium]|nr:50S ribosomal protein L2 [Candidatus Sungbacteria bacterium]
MKKYKPTSAGRRAGEIVDFSSLTKKEPERSLVHGFHRAQGRNNYGRITTRHKGGRVKTLYREVDFMYDKKDVSATVEALEYDPNRSGFIALIRYADGERRYVLAPQQMKPGSTVIISEKAPIEIGCRTMLRNIPIGTFVYNIELKPGLGSQMVRSAGIGAQVLAHEGDHTNVKLPSGEVRRIPSISWACIGMVSNPEHSFMTIGKAGRNRHLGIRPTVRGSVMNPRDHPHGGGEGKTQLGLRRPKTPWGKTAKGVKTRNRKRKSNKFILSRRTK